MCHEYSMNSPTTQFFDVAIVGAGPAGSAAALAAAQHGARVLLVDRAEFPRTKVCGSCLAESGVETLRNLHAAGVLTNAIPLRSVHVSCGDRHSKIARTAGVSIGREELDAALLNEVRNAGVTVALATRARMQQDRVLTLAGVELHGAVRARTTIIADGLSGNTLDDLTEFSWRIAQRSFMGFGAIVPARSVACLSHEIRMRVSTHGYIGAVELPSGEIDIAAAVDPQALRMASGVSQCALQMLGEDTLDRAALVAARWRGTPLLTRRRARVAANGVLVVGDAAGYVEPFTGEGMTWALVTGALAGTLAATHPSPHRVWPQLYNARMRWPRLRCVLFAKTLRAPRLVRTVLCLSDMLPTPFAFLTHTVGRMSTAQQRYRRWAL
jgi:flavin-dependent dehydrogenase